MMRVGNTKPLDSWPTTPVFDLMRLVLRAKPRSIRRFDRRFGSHLYSDDKPGLLDFHSMFALAALRAVALMPGPRLVIRVTQLLRIVFFESPSLGPV